MAEVALGRVARIAAVMVGLVAASVLVGWYWAIPSLVRVAPAFVAMQDNTAVALGLSAGLLYAFTIERPTVSAALGIAVTAIGGATLVEHLSGTSLGIDELLWHLGVSRAAMHAFADMRPSSAGRMAPVSSICLTMLGLSTVILARRSRPSTRAHALAAALALTSVVLAGVALSGYVTGVPTAYG
jgi:hypothetical protein